MTPKLYDMLLALVEVLICLIHTLEDLGNITHVKNVMTLRRGWQEVLLNHVKQINGCKGHWLTQVLYLLIEVLEFEGCNRLKDFLHLSFCWDSVVHNVELALKSARNLGTTTTWLAHSR